MATSGEWVETKLYTYPLEALIVILFCATLSGECCDSILPTKLHRIE